MEEHCFFPLWKKTRGQKAHLFCVFAEGIERSETQRSRSVHLVQAQDNVLAKWFQIDWIRTKSSYFLVHWLSEIEQFRSKMRYSRSPNPDGKGLGLLDPTPSNRAPIYCHMMSEVTSLGKTVNGQNFALEWKRSGQEWRRMGGKGKKCGKKKERKGKEREERRKGNCWVKVKKEAEQYEEQTAQETRGN